MSLAVLIVDDSPLMRTLIKRIVTLAEASWAEDDPLQDRIHDPIQCYEAGDGRQALDQLSRTPVDLILTDMNMPGMDGEQFMRELNQRGILRTTPAIVVSTDATKARVQKMLDLGAVGYICKPFSPEAMRSELDRVWIQRQTGEPA